MMERNNVDILKRTAYAPSSLQVREAEADKGSRTIEGYAILFNVPSDPLWVDEKSEAREVIAPEAITRELLDGCDIKFTMFHDRQLLLARSKQGAGTLSYEVDEKGVRFAFDAPNTIDGDKALELVRRGELSGCSFTFRVPYRDAGYVERSVVTENGRSKITYRVKKVIDVLDFTLAADPAYPDTSVRARELEAQAPSEPDRTEMLRQVSEMRAAANKRI